MRTSTNIQPASAIGGRPGFGDDGWTAELKGEIVHLVALGMADDKAPRPALRAEALCSAKVIVGARNHLNLLFMARSLEGNNASKFCL